MNGQDDGAGEDMAGQGDGERVRDLLRRCGVTTDPAERAALLARVAVELDCGAQAADRRDIAAALRGQAALARYMAEQERSDRARRAAGERAATGKHT